MGKIKKYRNSLERFMSGETGQRFFNIAYSIGAAIVILGALFKILHITGGDTLLAIGMATEVLMFILIAFDHPAPQETPNQIVQVSQTQVGPSEISTVRADSGSVGISSGPLPSLSADAVSSISENITKMQEEMEGYIERMSTLNRNLSGLNTIYEIQLRSASSQLDSMENVGKGMKEMRRLYEDTAERSNSFREEAEKLTENMKKLNEVYENMLRAMNVNR